MTQQDFCPKVQCSVGDGKQQTYLMVDPKAPKPLGSVFLMKLRAFHSSLKSSL